MIYLVIMFLIGMLLAAAIGGIGLYSGYNFYMKDKGGKKSKWEQKFEEASESEEPSDEQ